MSSLYIERNQGNKCWSRDGLAKEKSDRECEIRELKREANDLMHK